eukprot:7734546-Pyramimonas_sp.AAC.1
MGFVEESHRIRWDSLRSPIGSDWTRIGVLQDPMGFESNKIPWDSYRSLTGSYGIRVIVLQDPMGCV